MNRNVHVLVSLFSPSFNCSFFHQFPFAVDIVSALFLSAAGLAKNLWTYCSGRAAYDDLSIDYCLHVDSLPSETTSLQNRIVT